MVRVTVFKMTIMIMAAVFMVKAEDVQSETETAHNGSYLFQNGKSKKAFDL